MVEPIELILFYHATNLLNNLSIVDNYNLTLIGIIVSILAIAISVIIAVFQKKAKRLSYRIFAENKLLTTREITEGKVKVSYEGSEVNDIVLLVLCILNNGDLPIARDDFDSSIVISFAEDCKILSLQVIKTVPKSLRVKTNLQNNNIVIDPLLLNSRDALYLKILLSKVDHGFNINARIKGIRCISKMFKINAGYEVSVRIFNWIIYISGLMSWAGIYLFPRPLTPVTRNIGIYSFMILFCSILVRMIMYIGYVSPKQIESYMED
jgi:hypothetical protein